MAGVSQHEKLKLEIISCLGYQFYESYLLKINLSVSINYHLKKQESRQ